MKNAQYLIFPGKEKLKILKESLDGLSRVETIIFDIDGVLIDVSRSFRVAISKTLQTFFSKHMGLKGKTLLVKPSETVLFKNAGGFNNDWELTEAAVFFYLFKYFKTGSKDFLEIKSNPPSLKSFLDDVRVMGGGLENVILWVERKVSSSEILEKIYSSWDRERTRNIFKELYAGRYASKLYPEDKGFSGDKIGLLEKERVLLDESIIDSSEFNYGILTGRTKEETELVMEKMPKVKSLVSKKIRVDDGGALKPNPKSIAPLLKSSNYAIYIGDIYDDLATVRNFNSLGKKTSLFFAAVVRNSSEENFFIKLKADIIARNVNSVLRVLKELRLERK